MTFFPVAPRESGDPAALKGGWTCILASRYRGTLYTGVTADMARRIWEHREGIGSEFVRRYGVTRLVHVERFDSIGDAIAREKAIKKWRRAWKFELIERDNPDWEDLFERINR